MKKPTNLFLSTLTMALLFGALVSAAPADTKAVDDEKQNTVMAQLTEQILNSINQASIDFNITQITFDESKADEKRVTLNDVTSKGMISFSKDWEVEIIKADPKKMDEANASSMKKMYPKAKLDSQNIWLSYNLQFKEDVVRLDARFYSHFDSVKKVWVERPLTLKVSNQLNKQLITIRLFSMQVTQKPHAQDPQAKSISGTCVSDKILLNPETGKNKQVLVKCSFEGTLAKGRNKFTFKYEDK